MATATLESLPAEVLLHICEYLERNYMASVAAFARASKYCYFAVTALLFRTVKFDVSSSLQHSRDVHECYNMLQRAASFGHVRRLVVDSQPRKADDEPDPHNQWHRPTISAEERGYSDEIFYGLHGNRPTFYETIDDWEPLAKLVQQLPSLVDLIFGCTSPFPPCLLLVLQRRRQCRLHISRFKLHSLNASVTDAHEFMLASSPCLYSIGLRYEEGGGMAYGIANYEREAVMRLVAGLAPNLKEVHLFHFSEGVGIYDETPWQPWKGFTLDNEKHSSSQGSLRFLRLSTYEDITSQLVKDWRASTDFSVLRTLKLESIIEEDAAEFLSTNCSFPSLTNLSLKLGARNHDDPPPTRDYFDAANRFLRSLPRLNTLSLVGNIPQVTLDTTLGHHGSSLHKLLLACQQVTGLLLQRHIADIKEYCPLLEDLSLSIPRSRGDASEVAAYKTLGSIPRLQRLRLDLDASDFAVLCEDDDDDDEERNIPNDPTLTNSTSRTLKNHLGRTAYPVMAISGTLL